MDINNSVLAHLFSWLGEQEVPERQSCTVQMNMTLTYMSATVHVQPVK